MPKYFSQKMYPNIFLKIYLIIFLEIYLNIFLINKGKDKMLQAFRDWVTMIHTKYPLADYKIHA